MIASFPHAVHAQPVVVVRAETRIELRIEHGSDVVRIRATLRDDRGDALPDRPLRISVRADGQQRHALVEQTDESGQVVLPIPIQPGSYHVEATYEGEASYDRVRVGQLIDLERAHVRLSISAIGAERLDRIDLDRVEHTLRVSASSPEGGAGLSVELSNELREHLASGTTSGDGSVLLTLRSDALGPPAAGRLVVHTPGDASRSRAQTEVLVVRYRPTVLTLDLATQHVEAGEPIRVEGRLTTSEGPLARKAIGIFAAERHIETVLTDADGVFVRELVLEENEGEVALRAVFESDAPWRPEARSEPLMVRVEPRGSTPLPWLLVPIVVCALVLLFVSWLARRRRRPTEARESLAPAPPGIVLSAAAGTRGPPQRGVAGIVLDTDEGQALALARVELRRGDDALLSTSDAEGRFSIDQVPDGRWTLRVSRVGYEARDAVVELPHRGSLSGLEVRLRSLRQVALAGYRPLADALTPARRWWAFWTPRELADRAGPGVRRDVEAVTGQLEEAVYAAALPRDEEVAEIERRSEKLAGELAARSAPGAERR